MEVTRDYLLLIIMRVGSSRAATPASGIGSRDRDTDKIVATAYDLLRPTLADPRAMLEPWGVYVLVRKPYRSGRSCRVNREVIAPFAIPKAKSRATDHSRFIVYPPCISVRLCVRAFRTVAFANYEPTQRNWLDTRFAGCHFSDLSWKKLSRNDTPFDRDKVLLC